MELLELVEQLEQVEQMELVEQVLLVEHGVADVAGGAWWNSAVLLDFLYRDRLVRGCDHHHGRGS